MQIFRIVLAILIFVALAVSITFAPKGWGMFSFIVLVGHSVWMVQEFGQSINIKKKKK